jgi:hypothetical protein
VIRTAAFALALAVTAAAAAADTIPAKDRALPIYPRVSLPESSALPANFWSSGAYREMAFLEVVSQDDAATVDAWYRPRLGTFTRKTFSADGSSGTYYEGPGGIVKVQATAGTAFAKYGKTVIFLDPKR